MSISAPPFYPALVNTDPNYASTTIWGNGVFQSATQRLGPYRGANSRLYLVLPWTSGGNFFITVHESTDEGLTWAEIDAAHHPQAYKTISIAFGSAAIVYGCFFESSTDRIWVVYSGEASVGNGPLLRIIGFNLTTRLWQSPTATGGPAVSGEEYAPLLSTVYGKVYLARRSDSSFVVVYQHYEAHSGYYITRTWLNTWSGAWGTPVEPFNNLAGTYGNQNGFGSSSFTTPGGNFFSESPAGIALGTDDRVHVIEANNWIDYTNPALYPAASDLHGKPMVWHVSLSKTGVLDTPAVVNPLYVIGDTPGQSVTQPKPVGDGTVSVAYRRATDGNEVNLGYVNFTSQANPVFTIEQVYSSPSPATPYTVIGLGTNNGNDLGHALDIAIQDSNNISLFVSAYLGSFDNSDTIFVFERLSGTWGNPIEIYTPAWELDSFQVEYVGGTTGYGIPFSFDVSNGNGESGITEREYFTIWPIAEVVTATLTLQKVVSNTHGGTAVATDWTVRAIGPATLSGVGSASSPGLPTGTYALSEGGPPGYSASAWVCVGGSQSGSNITLAGGDVVTCTITNSDVEPPPPPPPEMCEPVTVTTPTPSLAAYNEATEKQGT